MLRKAFTIIAWGMFLMVLPFIWLLWDKLKWWYYGIEKNPVKKKDSIKAVTNKSGKQKTSKEEPGACPYKVEPRS